jgi:hypothetical protein
VNPFLFFGGNIMGASSVTGVGQGSAEGRTQARYSQAIPVSLINGPKVVAAGVWTSQGGAPDYISLPTINGATGGLQYVVICNDITNGAAAYGLFTTSGTDPLVQSIAITGTSGHNISWALIQVGTGNSQASSNLLGSGRAAQAPNSGSFGG